MPHIIIKMYPGRSEEVKKEMVSRIAADVMETAGVPEASVSVSIEEIPKEQWEEQVYGPDMLDKKQTLYKTPGYGKLAE